MEIIPFGSDALLVSFSAKIDIQTNEEVFKAYDYLKKKNIQGINSLVPAYHSLLISFDPNLWNAGDLSERIFRFVEKMQQAAPKGSGKNWHLPVCYEEEFGLDLPGVSKTQELEVDEIINLHLSKTYRVFMVGFLPGFPYLGILPEQLHVARKNVPRKSVPAGSVGLAGMQTGIYPYDSPGGWQIIGRTPIRLFDPNWKKPSLFSMGDTVHFHKITTIDFSEWQSIPVEDAINKMQAPF